MITTVRLVSTLWITGLLSKDTVDIYAAVASGLLNFLTRFFPLLLSKKPRDVFVFVVSIFRLDILLLLSGRLVLIMICMPPIILGLNVP